MQVVDGLDGSRSEFVEHGKVVGVGEFHQKLRTDRYPGHRFADGKRGLIGRTARRLRRSRIRPVGRPVHVATGLGEALIDQQRGGPTQVIQGGFVDLIQLLVVGE